MVCFGSQNISELKFLSINCDSSLLDYMLMFLEQNGGQSDNTNIANKSFENVSHPKRIGTTLPNQHCAYQETKSSLLRKFTFVRKTKGR